MTIVVRNPMYRAIALVLTLAIIAILYFAVIKPSNDTANTAIVNGEKQAQQAVRAAGNNVPAGVKNLTDCLVAAGTDTGKIQACQAKFKP